MDVVVRRIDDLAKVPTYRLREAHQQTFQNGEGNTYNITDKLRTMGYE
jgi:hypothetical protein